MFAKNYLDDVNMPFNLPGNCSSNPENSSTRQVPTLRVPSAVVSPSWPLAGVVQHMCSAPLDEQGAQASADTWIVHTQEGDHRVRCAASCLLVPQLSDVVLLSLIEGQWWVTSVLVVASRERAVLRVHGVHELALQAPVVSLQAQLSCHVDSPVLDLDTRQLEVKAHTTRLTVSVLQLVARSLTVMAQRVHSFSDQLTSSCRVRTVQVDEVDSLAVRHAVTTAETSSLQAGQVLVNARDTVRVDGTRIMMG